MWPVWDWCSLKHPSVLATTPLNVNSNSISQVAYEDHRICVPSIITKLLNKWYLLPLSWINNGTLMTFEMNNKNFWFFQSIQHQLTS